MTTFYAFVSTCRAGLVVRLLLLLVALLGSTTALMAQTYTWTGNFSTDWDTGGNWNQGTVPHPAIDVVIPSGPARQPVLGTTAYTKSVEVKSGASLSITAAGVLQINGSKNNIAFLNGGTVTNGGQILIGNQSAVTGSGLANQGTFQNTGAGLIQIDRTTGDGVSNQAGTFTNSATITIGAAATVGGSGIGTQSIFQNNTGGVIQIDRVTGNGITNLASTFTNSATITVGSLAPVGASGIGTQAAFQNNAGGFIQIDQTGSHAIGMIGGSFTNASVIRIGSLTATGGFGIQANGTFQNNTGGAIQIDRTGSHGIGINNGTFTNAAGISIGSIAPIGAQGISNGGSFTNTAGATISINRTPAGVGGDGIYNTGTFANAGGLTIGDVIFGGQDDIFTQGTFTNAATGDIRLDRATGNGIWANGGSFQNAGRIVLGANATTGASGILNTAVFGNNAGGDIVIDRPTGNALVNANSAAVFTNAARIRIGQNFAIGNLGLSNSGSAVFRNNAGGNIAIDRTNNDGLTNLTLATLVNSATIAVGTALNSGSDGLDNSATFTNNACAVLTVADNVSNAGSFTNAGLFTVNTNQAHTNTGTLTNNGLISYPSGNPIPNVVNNAVIAGLTASLTPTFSPALQLGVNSGQFSIGTTWYSDAALTQPAGSYNQGTNTFTASAALAPGSSKPLYFAATDGANSCPKTVTITLVGSSLPTPILRVLPAASPSTILTTGTTTLSATASGGIGPYTYSFSGPGTIVQNGNMATVSGLPAGVQSFTVLVIDSDPFLNQKASDVVSVTVNAVPVVVPVPTALTLTASASPTTIFTNGSTTLSASASGGTPGYSYSFSGPGTIVQSGNTATVSGLPVGVQTFTVSVQDATSPTKQSVSRVVSVTVNAVPTVPPVVVPPVAVPFSATVVSYNCQTGVLVLGSVGSSPGPAVEYAIPGVTNFTSGTTFTLNEGLRRDATTITINVQQGGIAGASFVFDLRAFCTGGGQPTPVPTPTPTPPIPTTALSATVVSYNCGTGNLVVGSTGGTGTAVEYAIPGVTNFTSGTTFTLNEGLRRDAGTITINVRQSGVAGTPFVFNLRAFCQAASGARFGVGDEPVSALRVRVLGNPAVGEAVVEISGAAGASVQMRLVDLGGRLVESRSVPVAGAVERQVFDLHDAPSVLLLQVTGAGQSRTVKIVQE